MKRVLVFLAALAAISACNRPDPRAQDVDARKIAEEADENRQRKPLPDASLTAIIKSALISDSSLDANKIDIENKQGNVALYGSVESPEQRERVERIVMSVGGVRSVANNLTVSEDSAGRGGR